MNREIKFRGKRVDNGEWVYGFLLQDSMSAKVYIVDWMDFPDRIECNEVLPESVGQFTGLKDKNGKEIYEGDIMRLNDLIVPVQWHDGAFHIFLSPNQGSNGFIQDRAKNFVIIGSIHENPELLNQ